MAVRRAYGNGAAALIRIEVPPVDEWRAPEGAPVRSRPVERRPDGTLTPAGARALGSRGGVATRDRRRYASQLADQLGLVTVPEELRPYVDVATDFAHAELARLRSMFGDVGPGPSSMVQSAALALAASRAAFAAGDASKGARLADQSRQTLLTAHHLCELEAKAKPPAPADAPWLEDEADGA